MDWLNNETGGLYDFEYTDLSTNEPWFQGMISITSTYAWRPIGAGWRKLGLETTDDLQLTHSGRQTADFSQTAAVLISIDNIGPGISSG